MTGVQWVELSPTEGIYGCVADGKPTGVTSLVDLSRPVQERSQDLRRQVTELGRYGWLPDSVLAACLDDLDRSVAPDRRMPRLLPAAHLAPPFRWPAVALIRYGELAESPLADWFFPRVDGRSGELILEAGETQLFATKVRPIAVWWREPGASTTDPLPSMPMKDIDGWPTLVLTDRRLCLHGPVERCGDVDDRVLLATFLPTIDRIIHLTRETKRAFGRSGLYWGTQVRHEWIRSIVVRHTNAKRPKGLVNRLLLGSGGESDQFGIEVALPTGRRAEIYFDKGEPGMVKLKSFIDVDTFVQTVMEAVERSPVGLTVERAWKEDVRHLEQTTETHRYRRVVGALPISFVM